MSLTFPKKFKSKRNHRSIFVKLLMVILTTMLMVHFMIGGLFGILFGKRNATPLKKNMNQYVGYLIREIGTPPDTVKALTLAKALNFDIRIESDSLTWTTRPEWRLNEKTKKPYALRVRRPILKRPTLILHEGNTTYYFKWKFTAYAQLHRELFYTLILIITLIFIIANHFIRKILKPIKWLRKGVEDVSKGQLETEIPVIKEDELGTLSRAFNTMTRRIKAMLESRDQLLLDVSHELRSPITRIKVALEFLPDSDKKTGILADLAEIETMITEILESERLNSEFYTLKRISTNVSELISQVIRDFESRTPGIEFHPVQVNVDLDAERIKMVLKNVLENAFKYARTDSKPIQIMLEKQRAGCMITITDDGLGIPEKDLNNIFEPFYRVDRSRTKDRGGYGLGLHMCKKIMEAHNGAITIRNNSTRGITVSIQLPE